MSLCSQTGLHCLIIQILNTRVCFLNVWYTSLTSVNSNLEHGLVTLTETFSPLESELHNHLCGHPNEKCTLTHTIPFYIMHTSIQSEPVWTSQLQPKLDAFKSQDVEWICVHFSFSDLDILYIKTTSLMSRFQIWSWSSHTINHMHVTNVYICDIFRLQQCTAKG